MINIKPGQIYRHFKGGRYWIIDIAQHTTTDEMLVVYQALSGDSVWARPIQDFVSEVDRTKYPDVRQVHRFEYEEG